MDDHNNDPATPSPPSSRGTVIVVTGELDIVSADDLRARLRAARRASSDLLVVDLSAVTFIDCSGLRALAETHAEVGDRLQLRGVPACVRRLIDLTGLEELLAGIDPTSPPATRRLNSLQMSPSQERSRPSDHRRPSRGTILPASVSNSDSDPDLRPAPSRSSEVHGSSLTETGAQCVAHLLAHAPLDLWMLTRVQDDGQVVLAAAGPWAVDLPDGTVLPWLGSFSLHMAAGTAPPVAPRTADVPPYAAAANGRWSSVHAYTGVPVLRDDGDLTGVLCGFSRHPDDPAVTLTATTLQLLGGILSAVATVEDALHKALADLDRSRLLADTDALTDLRNRRGWHTALTRETERCGRYHTTAGIVSVDLDELKTVNDTHGHGAGDVLLQDTAHVLRQAVRPSDLVARPGGDEFTVLAVEVDQDAVTVLSDRVVERLHAAGIAASTGSAVQTPGEHLTDTWRRADAAMYTHKRARALSRQD